MATTLFPVSKFLSMEPSQAGCPKIDGVGFQILASRPTDFSRKVWAQRRQGFSNTFPNIILLEKYHKNRQSVKKGTREGLYQKCKIWCCEFLETLTGEECLPRYRRDAMVLYSCLLSVYAMGRVWSGNYTFYLISCTEPLLLLNITVRIARIVHYFIIFDFLYVYQFFESWKRQIL